MTTNEIDELVEDCASDLLSYLSKIVPNLYDDGALSELILLKALEYYKFVVENSE